MRHSNRHSDSWLTLQKLHGKSFWLKYIKNESHIFCSGNKEQGVMFPVVFRSSVHFGFPCLFLRAWSDVKLKPNSRKIELNEITFVCAYKPIVIPPKRNMYSGKLFCQFSPHFVATKTVSQFFVGVSLLGETLYNLWHPYFFLKQIIYKV